MPSHAGARTCDPLAAVLALACAVTPGEVHLARMAAIATGGLGSVLDGLQDCPGPHGHSLALGCPADSDPAGEWTYRDHGPLTLAARIANLAPRPRHTKEPR